VPGEINDSLRVASWAAALMPGPSPSGSSLTVPSVTSGWPLLARPARESPFVIDGQACVPRIGSGMPR
jgi:hypothetical protein